MEGLVDVCMLPTYEPDRSSQDDIVPLLVIPHRFFALTAALVTFSLVGDGLKKRNHSHFNASPVCDLFQRTRDTFHISGFVLTKWKILILLN